MTELSEQRPGLSFLLTTGTVTSAKLAAERLGPRAVHQYAPLDAPEYVRSFLDHWRPDLAVFTESEIWPNLILESSARDIPLALINARMTKRSFRRWRRSLGVARPAVQPLLAGAGAERHACAPLQDAWAPPARSRPAISRSTRRRRRSTWPNWSACSPALAGPRAADGGEHARRRGCHRRRGALPAAPDHPRSVHHHRAAPSRARPGDQRDAQEARV